jgi:hypothetical protein
VGNMHTAIESLSSCGRLDSLIEAAAEEEWRIAVYWARGARKAARARLEEIRIAIVSCTYRKMVQKKRE